jgi:hypothetical protein
MRANEPPSGRAAANGHDIGDPQSMKTLNRVSAPPKPLAVSPEKFVAEPETPVATGGGGIGLAALSGVTQRRRGANRMPICTIDNPASPGNGPGGVETRKRGATRSTIDAPRARDLIAKAALTATRPIRLVSNLVRGRP